MAVFSSKDSIETIINILAEARARYREVENRKNSSFGDIKKAANTFHDIRIAAIREIESRINPAS